MKKILIGAISFIMSGMLLLSGCTTNNTADNSLDNVKNKKELVLGLDAGFPPMGYKDDQTGEIIGVDIDLAKEVAKRMGVTLKLQPINWDNKFIELNSKNIDIIWNGFSVSDERKQQVLFSKPYLSNEQVIVVQKNSEIKNKADLAGKQVGTQVDSSGLDALTKDTATYESIGKNNVSTYKDYVAAFLELEIGRVQAVVVDSVVAKYYIAKMNANFEILSENFGTEDYAVGFRKGDQKLADEIGKIMDEMKKDGTTKTISEKWFNDDIIK